MPILNCYILPCDVLLFIYCSITHAITMTSVPTSFISNMTKSSNSHCLFSVRQRMASILLCEPPALYSAAHAQVLIIFETVYVTIIERNLFSQ